MENFNQKSNSWYEKKWAVVILCIIFFPVGLYGLWKNSSIKIGWKIGVFAFFALIIIANIADKNEGNVSDKKSSMDKSDGKKLDILFDIPTLEGKNIDEIVKVWGIPSSNTEPTKLQLKNGVNEWDKSYKKGGYELLITYNPKTRNVIDFFIGTKDSSGKTNNYTDLLQIANISENSKTIIVEPVKTVQDPEFYTGIKIKMKSSIDKEEAITKKEWENSKAGKIQKKHPDWTKEECEDLANHKIWIGMTLEMLKFERGNPNSANPSNYGNGTHWQWCWDDYTPSCFYGGDDQIITSYN